MRLIGYINSFIENCFTIPIYKNDSEDEYFYHILNDDYEVIGFEKNNLKSHNFVFLNTYIDIFKDDFGGLVFVGKDKSLFIDKADNVILRIKKYLNETTSENEFLNIKEEVKDIHKKISIKNFTKNNLSSLRKRLPIVRQNLGARTIFDKDIKFPVLTMVDEARVVMNKDVGVYNNGLLHSSVYLLNSENFIINKNVSKISNLTINKFISAIAVSDFDKIYSNEELKLIYGIYVDFLKYKDTSHYQSRKLTDFLNVLRANIKRQKIFIESSEALKKIGIDTGDIISNLPGYLPKMEK